MKYYVSYDEGHARVVLTGALAAADSSELHQCFAELFAAGRFQVTLEMSRVDFIDSAGLGALVTALRDIEANNGAMRLVNLRPPLRRIFEVTQLDSLFSLGR